MEPYVVSVLSENPRSRAGFAADFCISGSSEKCDPGGSPLASESVRPRPGGSVRLHSIYDEAGRDFSGRSMAAFQASETAAHCVIRPLRRGGSGVLLGPLTCLPQRPFGQLTPPGGHETAFGGQKGSIGERRRRAFAGRPGPDRYGIIRRCVCTRRRLLRTTELKGDGR